MISFSHAMGSYVRYPKILKSQDPLVMSIGWRRFQVCPSALWTSKDVALCAHLGYQTC